MTATLLKKETLTQMFSCEEVCNILKNTNFVEHFRMAASE